VWLHGQLVWPEGYQPETPVWVYLMAGAAGRGGLDAVLLRESGVTESPYQTSILPDAPWERNTRGSVLYKVPAARDGSFQVPMPAWRPALFVQVLGDHVYRSAPVSIPRGLGQEPLVIDLELGVHVIGTLQGKGASLEGFVRTYQAKALDQALNPTSQNNQGRFYTRSDAEGHFELRGLPPREALSLEALPENLARTIQAVGPIVAGQTVEVLLELGAGRSLQGRVTDPEGKPIAGATVLIHADEGPFSNAERELRRVTSGQDGRFEASGLPVAGCTLRAHHPAYLASEVRKIDATTPPGELVLHLEMGKQIHGRTEWADGSPAPHLQVTTILNPAQLKGMEGLVFTRNMTSAPTAESDSEGRFVLRGMADLPYDLTARGEKDGNPIVGRTDAVRPRSEEEIVITVGLFPTLDGQFVDDQGEPIPEYTLFFRRASKGEFITLYEGQALRRIQDPEGRFHLIGLDPGTWQVQARAERFVLTPPAEVTLPREPGAAPWVLQGTPAGWVDGVVLDPEGQPFEGARVRLEHSGLAVSVQLEVGPLDPEAVSQADGSFSLGPLPLAPHAIRAHATNLCPSETWTLDLTDGRPIDGIVLNLRQGGALSGEVLDDTGSPSPGRMITVVASDSPGDNHTTQTDAKGSFLVEHLEPGDYQVVAMQGMRAIAEALEQKEVDIAGITGGMKTATAKIVDGETTHVVLGTPPSQPIRVEGSVTLGGQAVTSGFVSFSANGRPIVDNLAITNLDKSGHFETVLDGAGRYRITVQRVGGSMLEQSTCEFVRDIPAEDQVVVHLELPEGRISGQVLDASGKPAGNVRLSVFAEGATSTDTMLGGSYVETLTGPEGKFDVRGLQAGSYYVSAGGAQPLGVGGRTLGGHAPGRVSSDTLVLKEGEWIDNLRLKLRDPGTLRATLVDEAGAPVAGASIFVRDAKGRALEAFSLITSDDSGVCEYQGIAPGSYTVSARTADLASQEIGPFAIESGEATAVRLVLQPGTVLHLSFRDTDGQPSAARIQVLGPEGQDMARLFGMQDMQRLYSKDPYEESERLLGPLPPGPYRIQAVIQGESVEKSVRLRGEASKRLTLRAR
ncbi:MAG TPA: carboxypeptidase-like regulatory domain-containing protein, partial [Planctomycetota bacterium]|nr:carboxypeptidase-like regulatory domain-containing protein [Planctomycetota bacterium]